MIENFVDFIEEQKTKGNELKQGTIKALDKQTADGDYYDIEIDGNLYSSVSCPIPQWLSAMLQQDVSGGLVVMPSRVITLTRKQLFQVGENVQVYFPGGRKTPTISIESSGIQIKAPKVVYI